MKKISQTLILGFTPETTEKLHLLQKFLGEEGFVLSLEDIATELLRRALGRKRTEIKETRKEKSFEEEKEYYQKKAIADELKDKLPRLVRELSLKEATALVDLISKKVNKKEKLSWEEVKEVIPRIEEVISDAEKTILLEIVKLPVERAHTVIEKLIKIADKLDKKELIEEANIIDKIAQELTFLHLELTEQVFGELGHYLMFLREERGVKRDYDELAEELVVEQLDKELEKYKERQVRVEEPEKRIVDVMELDREGLERVIPVIVTFAIREGWDFEKLSGVISRAFELGVEKEKVKELVTKVVDKIEAFTLELDEVRKLISDAHKAGIKEDKIKKLLSLEHAFVLREPEKLEKEKAEVEKLVTDVIERADELTLDPSRIEQLISAARRVGVSKEKIDKLVEIMEKFERVTTELKLDKLISIADKLDKKGLFGEADLIDNVLGSLKQGIRRWTKRLSNVYFAIGDTEYEADVNVDMHSESEWGADANHRGVYKEFIDDIDIEEVRERGTTRTVEVTDRMEEEIANVVEEKDLSEEASSVNVLKKEGATNKVARDVFLPFELATTSGDLEKYLRKAADFYENVRLHRRKEKLKRKKELAEVGTIRKLVSIADKLDKKGLTEEANLIDDILKKGQLLKLSQFVSEEEAIKALDSPDRYVRLRATDWIGEKGDINLITRMLDDPSPHIRRVAISWIGKRGDINLITRMLDDPDWGVRQKATDWIGEKGDINLITRMLDDPNSDVRYMAIYWIEKKAPHLLKEILKEKELRERFKSL